VFEDHLNPNHVYKLQKDDYGLKQVPRQWYERLSNFLLSHNYERGKIDKTLFIKKSNFAVILVQIYVHDIIFGSTNDRLCEEFVTAMQGEFEILWIKQQLEDFGLKVNKVPLFCDNTSAINLTKNQVQHSRTKNIEIRHHFISDHISNGDCEVEFIATDK